MKIIITLILFVAGIFIATGQNANLIIGNETNNDCAIGMDGSKGSEVGTFFRNATSGVIKKVMIGIGECEVVRKTYKLNIYTLNPLFRYDKSRKFNNSHLGF